MKWKNIPQWSRELNLGNGGPSDLVFNFNDGNQIVIEFKMRDTADAYFSDLNKLSELKDEKTKAIAIDSFKTNQSWYTSEVHALVGIWKVN